MESVTGECRCVHHGTVTMTSPLCPIHSPVQPAGDAPDWMPGTRVVRPLPPHLADDLPACLQCGHMAHIDLCRHNVGPDEPCGCEEGWVRRGYIKCPECGEDRVATSPSEASRWLAQHREFHRADERDGVYCFSCAHTSYDHDGNTTCHCPCRPKAYDRGALIWTLTHHWPTETSGCECGWADLGVPWPKHLADQYERTAPPVTTKGS